MIIQTSAGPVEGTATPRSLVFAGIPYAAPPVGPGRFRPPRPAEPWEAPRAATAFGPAAAQPVDHLLGLMFGQPPFPTAEDCLTLNVWTPDVRPPEDSGGRPVLVWLHGGAFMTGSSRDPVFDGTRLAERRDLVVVTVNYRLGALGFLHMADLLGDEYAGSGNLGLLDQVAALRWVRDNIAAFGGDPGNVTLAGQSAGGMCVAALMTMPDAAGLFHKAIVQSGNGSYVMPPERATAVARRILGALDLDEADARRILDVPAESLMRAQETVVTAMSAESPGGGLPFAPVVDGSVLTGSPIAAFRAGKAARIPLVVGSTLEESRLMLLLGGPPPLDEAAVRGLFAAQYEDAGQALRAYRAVEPDPTPGGLAVALDGERMFRSGAFDIAAAHAAHTPEVWRYLFRWRSTAAGGELGACHSMDLAFTFDNLGQPGVEVFTGPQPPQSLADAMSDAWASFARTSEPGDAWPPFAGDAAGATATAEAAPIMIFDTESHVAADPLAAVRQLPAKH